MIKYIFILTFLYFLLDLSYYLLLLLQKPWFTFHSDICSYGCIIIYIVIMLIFCAQSILFLLFV